MPKDLTLYVTTTQAAEMLGTKPRNVQRLLEEGRIKGIRPSRDWLVYVPSVEKYRETKSNRGRPASGASQPQEADRNGQGSF